MRIRPVFFAGRRSPSSGKRASYLSHRHGPVLEHDLVGEIFGPRGGAGVEVANLEIDRARRFAEVDGAGLRAQRLQAGAGEDVLVPSSPTRRFSLVETGGNKWRQRRHERLLQRRHAVHQPFRQQSDRAGRLMRLGPPKQGIDDVPHRLS